eukprot:1824485-Rhodomonas_salina.3
MAGGDEIEKQSTLDRGRGKRNRQNLELTPRSRASALSKSPKARAKSPKSGSRSPARRGKNTEVHGQAPGWRRGSGGGAKSKEHGAYQHTKIHPGLRLCLPWTVVGHVGLLILFSDSKAWDVCLWLLHFSIFTMAAAFAPSIAAVFKDLSAWIWGISHLIMVCGLLIITSMITFLPMRIILGLAVFSYQGILHELVYGCAENQTSRHAAILASDPLARAGNNPPILPSLRDTRH